MTIAIRRLAGLLIPLALIVSACGPGAQPGSNTAARVRAVVVGDPLVKPRQVNGGALREGADTPQLKAFYEGRRWRTAWTPASAAELEQALEGALAHGLDPARFKAMIDSDDPTGRELDLTRAALAYGDALDHGLADPTEFFEVYAMEVNATDVPAGLSQALSSGGVANWLTGLAPQDEDYRILSQTYLRYREAAATQAEAPAIATGRLLRPGASDPRVPQIAARLRALGYLTEAPEAAAPQTGTTTAATAPVPDTVYSPQLVDAMKAFQNALGLKDDGAVGDDSVAILNAGPDDRARQIALNLEQRRWLPRAVAADRIDVNLPAGVLTWYRDGKVADSRRVIVGKPSAETPQLASAFSQLVVNPPWNVPDGIAKEEILPKGPAYLERQRMVVRNGQVTQLPGPGSALGLVKFDMKNRHAIYLHDTPSKTLFSTNERYLSHGCVRVDGAVEFARMLAEAYGKTAEFDQKLAAGQTAVVELGAEIPVRLLYHTVFTDPEGRVGFRPDPYGVDAALAAALGIPPPLARNVAQGGAGSLGP